MLAIHTDAPYEPLGHLAGGGATIEMGQAAAGGRDCMFGWAEQQDTPLCRDRHVVWGLDDIAIRVLAQTLVDSGFEVVVTEPMTEDQFGDHRVAYGMPHHYTRTHDH